MLIESRGIQATQDVLGQDVHLRDAVHKCRVDGLEAIYDGGVVRHFDGVDLVPSHAAAYVRAGHYQHVVREAHVG